MSAQTVWSVEVFEDGHFRCIEGGLSKIDASTQGKRIRKESGLRVRIAEYTPDEGDTNVVSFYEI